MSAPEFTLRGLGDARLAAHALAPNGAWLFAPDGARLLWTNAAGATLLGERTIPAALARHLDAADALRAQIAELAPRLRADGAPRLERLRYLGAPLGQLLTCSCARLALSDGFTAILVVAAVPVGRPLPFDRRLSALLEGIKEPLALFTADGTLAAANEEARAALGGAASLAAAGFDGMQEALRRDGQAEIATERTRASLFRLGVGRETAVAAIMTPFAARSMPEPAAEQVVEPGQLTVDGTPALSQAQTTNQETPLTAPPQSHESAFERPQRFVWQIDADGRFSATGDAFVALVGDAARGRPWQETAAAADPEGRLTAAMATRETFGNVALSWPIANGRIEATLSGLPVFNTAREAAGYRGFGLYRVSAVEPAEAPPAPIEMSAPPREQAQEPPREQVQEQPKEQPKEPVKPRRPEPIDDAQRNVLRFPSPEPRPPTLSATENRAFDEIARQLAARLDPAARDEPEPAPSVEPAKAEPPKIEQPRAEAPGTEAPRAEAPRLETPRVEPPPISTAASRGEIDRPLLERLPLGILVHRLDRLLYANPAFLARTGHADLNALIDSGGLDALTIEPSTAQADSHSDGGTPLTLSRPQSGARPIDARLFAISWDGDSAMALMLVPDQLPPQQPAPDPQPETNVEEIRRERDALRAILDVTTEGIVVVDDGLRVVTCNRSAEALFTRSSAEFDGIELAELFAPESRDDVRLYAESVRRADGASLRGHGREALARMRDDSTIPISLTMGRTPGDGLIFAMFRDLSQARAAEAELTAAKRQSERAATVKSDVLGKISHDIRAPISSIIGFAELMIEERFGPLGNPRYATYLKDIRSSAERIVHSIDDLADLSRVETGKIELTLVSVALNELVEQCVAITQPQANRERIIIRSSLAHSLPNVVADARALQQIVLSLIGTAIRLNAPGGQVIVSTALTDNGDVALRVRDTGAGLSRAEIAAALEPYGADQQEHGSRDNGLGHGSGISLSLTRALVEANRARFDIRSAGHSGTLIEILFSNMPQPR